MLYNSCPKTSCPPQYPQDWGIQEHPKHTDTHVYMYIHTQVHMHTYIHTGTHAHTQRYIYICAHKKGISSPLNLEL